MKETLIEVKSESWQQACFVIFHLCEEVIEKLPIKVDLTREIAVDHEYELVCEVVNSYYDLQLQPVDLLHVYNVVLEDMPMQMFKELNTIKDELMMQDSYYEKNAIYSQEERKKEGIDGNSIEELCQCTVDWSYDS
jgi:hypothetical protein